MRLDWRIREAHTCGPPLVSPGRLASSFRGKRIEQIAVSKARAESLRPLELSKDHGALGPAAKIRKLGETPLSSVDVLTFRNTGAQLNLLRQVKDSLSSVAA